MAVRRVWRDHRLAAFAAFAVFGLILGFVSYLKGGDKPIDAAYKTLCLLTLNFQPPKNGDLTGALQTARFAIPMITVWATLTAFGALLREQSDLIRSKHARGHIVICGLG